METTSLYDAALLAGFERFALPDGARLRYFNLVPNPALRPSSSLGYMMAQVSRRCGDPMTGWYLRDEELLVESFVADLNSAIAQRQSVFIGATAFALAHLLDTLQARGERYALPAGSRLMVTGGFKGRARIESPDRLYARACDRFAVAPDAIVAEYGMTELTSQYYAVAGGAYAGPPWLRARVVGPDRQNLARGEIGTLLHVDLANRSSCLAIQTEDLGVMTDDRGFVSLGRDREAPLRGCSLDAEDLQRRSLTARF